MSLAVRIIPTLLMDGAKLVKGQRFQSWRSVGHVEQAMRIYQGRKVDEVVLLDIGATRRCAPPDCKRVGALTHGFFTPVTVGGGVRSIADVRNLLAAGADKVAIGTAAWTDGIIRRAADIVGSQAIVVTLDVVQSQEDVDRLDIAGVRCMREVAAERAAWAEKQGAGEILLTSVDREGALEGYDLPLIEAVSQAVDIPVIAHGGCACYDDMARAIKAGASAVAAGALFQFTDATPRGAAEYLASHYGIETRIPA